MAMKTALKFIYPPTKPGQYTTVRKGRVELSPEFNICDVTGRIAAVARLKYLPSVQMFCSLRKLDVAQEHEEQCRTIPGLYEALKRYYPGFSPHDLVTVIDFEVLPAARHCVKCDRSEAACRCAFPNLISEDE
jgi:hypothetical protein